MENKTLYVLAQFDDETSKLLSQYYDRLLESNFVGTQTKNIPYHITLASYDYNHKNKIIERLEKIGTKSNEINVLLSHIGLFGLRVLFIEPKMSYELLSLQKQFQDSNENDTWVAHVTMLIDESNSILKALPVLNDQFKPTTAQIVSLALYEFFPMRLIKVVNLNKKIEFKNEKNILLENLNKLHTTSLGAKRIKGNLCLDAEDVVVWCKEQISKNGNRIIKRGKNYYVDINDCVITINANNYSIITAHRK